MAITSRSSRIQRIVLAHGRSDALRAHQTWTHQSPLIVTITGSPRRVMPISSCLPATPGSLSAPPSTYVQQTEPFTPTCGSRAARRSSLGVWFEEEPIPDAGDGLDIAQMLPVVLELLPQRSDVLVHQVALGHELSAPDCVEDLASCQRASGVRDQDVQEGLIQ